MPRSLPFINSIIPYKMIRCAFYYIMYPHSAFQANILWPAFSLYSANITLYQILYTRWRLLPVASLPFTLAFKSILGIRHTIPRRAAPNAKQEPIQILVKFITCRNEIGRVGRFHAQKNVPVQEEKLSTSTNYSGSSQPLGGTNHHRELTL